MASALVCFGMAIHPGKLSTRINIADGTGMPAAIGIRPAGGYPVDSHATTPVPSAGDLTNPAS
jgi:hypothetical protein